MRTEDNRLYFMMGQIAGVSNALIAMILVFGAHLSTAAYGNFEPVLTLAVAGIFVALMTNMFGGFISYPYRITGGVMMIATALPLAAISALYLLAPATLAGVIEKMAGAEIETVTSTLQVVGAALLVIELVSITAGVLTLATHDEPSDRDDEAQTVDESPCEEESTVCQCDMDEDDEEDNLY